MIENEDDAIFVALGSNLGGDYGSSREILNRALLGFGEIGLIVKAKSALWTSKAWPDPTQPSYLNAVVMMQTELSPLELLQALHAMEARFGRLRTAPNAPRSLDLDLIAFGRRVQAGPPVLPHPRAHERRFVMGPLAQIAPGWRHPVSGETAPALAMRASIGNDAEPVGRSPSALHKTSEAPM